MSPPIGVTFGTLGFGVPTLPIFNRYSRPYMQLFMQHLSSSAELEAMAEYNSQLTHANMGAALSVVAEFVESQLALKISCVPAIPLFGGGYVEERWSIGNFLS